MKTIEGLGSIPVINTPEFFDHINLGTVKMVRGWCDEIENCIKYGSDMTTCLRAIKGRIAYIEETNAAKEHGHY